MDGQQEKEVTELTIPRICGGPLKVTLKPGNHIFVVGANGSGKSALIQHLVSSNRLRAFRRISAHRQTWFESEGIDLTPRARREYGEHISQWEVQNSARWRDEFSQQKQDAVFFDLVASENFLARRAKLLVQKGNLEEARRVVLEEVAPFATVNELLAQGSLNVKLELTEDEEILAYNHCGGDLYSLAKMSDGERNAAILAATVVTAKSGTILLIDEPERHLHRAVIEPFLTGLFQQRNDCTLIISTHEIALPVSNPSASILIVRSCKWNGDVASAWDVNLLEPNTELPEDLKRAILGARKRVLFIEGDDASSLDLPLYSALFPGVSILSKGGFSEVQKAVAGLRRAQGHHHVEAFGLIDRDNLSEDEVKRLAKGFVFALNVYSVEALFYCSESIAAVAHRQAETLGRDADEMFEAATKAALDALHGSNNAERMAARRCERIVRNQIGSCLPNWKDIMGRAQVNFSFSVESPFPGELAQYRKLLSNSRLDQLVARYPLRETDALDAVSRALEFRTRDLYQQTLIARVREDTTLAQKIRDRTGPLSSILSK